MLSLQTHALDVGHSAGVPVLQGLNLRMGVGMLVALVGRNGMGKSTLLRTLAGELPPLGGQVRYAGKALHAMPRRARARLLSFAPARLMADGQLTVRQAVMLGRYPHLGWMQPARPEDREAVAQAMRLTRVDHLRDREVASLSDGERQRVNVALSLAQAAAFLLLDEPASHLDVTHQAELLLLLRSLANGQQRAVLYSTHDVPGALAHADVVWLVDGGGVEALDPRDAGGTARVERAFSTPQIRYDAASGRFDSLGL